MKENHSSQNAQESGTSSFTRLRSKLSFERMVEMGAKMGMENPLFLCHERAAKATTVINGKEYINFSTYDYLDLNTHPEITEAVTEAAKAPAAWWAANVRPIASSSAPWPTSTVSRTASPM